MTIAAERKKVEKVTSTALKYRSSERAKETQNRNNKTSLWSHKFSSRCHHLAWLQTLESAQVNPMMSESRSRKLEAIQKAFYFVSRAPNRAPTPDPTVKRWIPSLQSTAHSSLRSLCISGVWSCHINFSRMQSKMWKCFSEIFFSLVFFVFEVFAFLLQ